MAMLIEISRAALQFDKGAAVSLASIGAVADANVKDAAVTAAVAAKDATAGDVYLHTDAAAKVDAVCLHRADRKPPDKWWVPLDEPKAVK